MLGLMTWGAIVLAAAAAPPGSAADYIGAYADGPNHRIEIVTSPEGRLFAVIDDAKYPLTPTGPDEVTNNGGEKIPFRRGADGKSAITWSRFHRRRLQRQFADERDHDQGRPAPADGRLSRRDDAPVTRRRGALPDGDGPAG